MGLLETRRHGAEIGLLSGGLFFSKCFFCGRASSWPNFVPTAPRKLCGESSATCLRQCACGEAKESLPAPPCAANSAGSGLFRRMGRLGDSNCAPLGGGEKAAATPIRGAETDFSTPNCLRPGRFAASVPATMGEAPPLKLGDPPGVALRHGRCFLALSGSCGAAPPSRLPLRCWELPAVCRKRRRGGLSGGGDVTPAPPLPLSKLP